MEVVGKEGREWNNVPVVTGVRTIGCSMLRDQCIMGHFSLHCSP